MTTITTGSVRVFTFKTGILSRLAHDLRLTLGRFEVSWEGGVVRGRFWTSSLSVDGAVIRGAVRESTPSASDKRKIHGNITQKILDTARFPEVTFEGELVGDQLRGGLTMCGRTQRISIAVAEESGRFSGSVELTPTLWGIPPFKAIGGAIKLQDRVRVEFDLPASGAGT
jgi:hypothetical protein